MPEYNMLLDDENFDIIENDCKEWKRPKFNELTSKENIDLFLDFGWIREDKVNYILLKTGFKVTK